MLMRCGNLVALRLPQGAHKQLMFVEIYGRMKYCYPERKTSALAQSAWAE